MSISTDQLTNLKAKIEKIVADKAVNDSVWTASGAAHTTLARVQAEAAVTIQTASADVAAKDATAAASDATMTADVADLQAFVNTLNTTP